jgi:hypothetical protein
VGIRSQSSAAAIRFRALVDLLCESLSRQNQASQSSTRITQSPRRRSPYVERAADRGGGAGVEGSSSFAPACLSADYLVSLASNDYYASCDAPG